MPQSTGVLNEETLKLKSSEFCKVYSPEEMKAYSFYLRCLNKAKEQRDTPNKYFDDLDFITDFYKNENARNTYLKPKKNDSETRVNTGVFEKKMEAIVNELQAMNFQPIIRTFNKNDQEFIELGEDMTDIVLRTNVQEETDDEFWQEFYFELLTQRAVFVREEYVEKTLKDGKSKIKRAGKKIVSGLKVFLGDMTISPYKIDDQPYIVTVDVVDYETAKALYGDLKNFKYVKAGQPVSDAYMSGIFNYRFSELKENEVEIIKYESLPNDEYQVILNGVMMYPNKTPLPNKYCNKYSLRMYVLKTVSTNFAYGKPLSASARYLQDLNDEIIRLLIRKFQQAVEPPLGVSKKVYSRDIWDPGAITQGIKSKEFEILTNHNGVTDSEFAMLELVERKTEEFIGASDLQQGLTSNKERSATEILSLNKQFIKQLGVAVLAISRAKKDLSESRLYNVLTNYTKPTESKYDPITGKIRKIFRSFTIDKGKFENGMIGRKVINFMDRDLSQAEKQNIYNEEEKISRRGTPVRFKSINVEKLLTLPKFWYVIVESQDKEGTSLDKVLFQEQLNQGVVISKITGKPLEPDTLVTEFERKWKAKNFFKKEAPQDQMLAKEGENVKGEAQKILDQLQGAGGNLGNQIANGLSRESTQKPSINRVNSEAM